MKTDKKWPSREWQKWILSFLLLLPVFLAYAWFAYLDPQGFTGFIRYDQPTYFIVAKDYQNRPFSLLYSLAPFWDDYVQIPPRLFQIQIFLIGMVLKYTSISIKSFNLLLLFLFGITSARIGIYFFETMTQEKKSLLGLILFFWGGGLLCLASFFYYGKASYFFVDFDPTSGWWFLNYGRNFIYPLEAYYHGLFFLSALFLIQRKYLFLILSSLSLLLSHHFTGCEWMGICLSFLALDLLVSKREIPKRKKKSPSPFSFYGSSPYAISIIIWSILSIFPFIRLSFNSILCPLFFILPVLS